MWHFFTITAQLTLQQCLQHILNIYMRYCLQLHYPVCWLFSLHMLSFYNVNIFPQLLYNCLFHYVYSEATLDTYSTVYNYSPQYTVCAVYISFLFTMWYFFTMTAQFTLQQCLQHILNIYIQYCSQLHYPVYWLCCLHMLSFSQCDIFPQWLHNSLYNNVYSISSTYTYGTVYNYTTQYTVFAITYAILFTIWYFFTITAQLTLQQCLQHILNIYIRYCLQLHYPVYWLCCLYMLPSHNVTFLHNYCTIDSTTMFTAYPQHIHAVLFTITLPSMLNLLFIYAFLFTMWYFSTITGQFTLQKCL